MKVLKAVEPLPSAAQKQAGVAQLYSVDWFKVSALTTGLAFDYDANGAVAVGIRPDQLMTYVENVASLHNWSDDPGILRAVEEAATQTSTSELTLDVLEEDRLRVARTVSQLVRDGNFRHQVLEAYDYRCAVTGLQLSIVQAAHILPVSAPGSVDDVRNGIALSPTYHSAYDDGLIYLDENFMMKLSNRRAEELARQNLASGLESFSAPLGRILFPTRRDEWPDQRLIERANRFRGTSS